MAHADRHALSPCRIQGASADRSQRPARISAARGVAADFLPVLNEAYAVQVARAWNIKASGAGYVTRFEVDADFIKRYEPQVARAAMHRELWVPAEELAGFNQHLIGKIVVTRTFPEA